MVAFTEPIGVATLALTSIDVSMLFKSTSASHPCHSIVNIPAMLKIVNSFFILIVFFIYFAIWVSGIVRQLACKGSYFF